MFGLLLLPMALGLSASEPVIFIDDQPSVRVQLIGYDLSRPEDQRRLHRKLLQASEKVCKAGIPGAVQNELFACTKDTIAGAQHQLDSIVADHRSGKPLVAAIEVTASRK